MSQPPEGHSQSVQVSYQKSKSFRVVHADGCYGGLSPRGYIHFAFYSERAAIPRRTTFDVVNGLAGPEKVEEGLPGVVRELETDVLMDIPAAAAFAAWLQTQLETARKQSGLSEEAWLALTTGVRT